MDFQQAVKTCFSKYATFSGRASRPEYWYFFLFAMLVNIATSMVDAVLFSSTALLNGLAALALLVPSLAVGARRLHDTNRSGWWLLVGLIPFIGWIILIVWFCQQGTAGANQFGPDPAALSNEHGELARTY